MGKGSVLIPLGLGVHLLPVVEDADDEAHHEGVLADVVRRRLLEGDLVDDSHYVTDLLDFYPSQLATLQELHVVLQTLLDDGQTGLDVLCVAWGAELLHQPAGVLNDVEEAIEQYCPRLIGLTKVEINQEILDKLDNQSDLEIRLLLSLLQHLHHLRIGILIEPLDVVVVQVGDALAIEVLVLDEFAEHLDENDVVGAQHGPEVKVAVGLVDEDGVGRGVGVKQGQRPQQISLPLAVAVLDAAHEFAEVVAVDAIVLEHAIDQHHQSHAALLEVLKRTIQVHQTILDLLGDSEHRVDIQGESGESFVHLLEGEDAMLGGQFLERGVGDWLDNRDLFEGGVHRIQNYYPGTAFIILSMDNFNALPLDQNTRCLAAQKVKARIIKDSFIRDGYIDSQQKLAQQVVRYSTLLSEKMLDKIKTEELRNFEKRVQDYCRESEKMESRLPSHSLGPAVSVSQFLTDFKRSTKVRLLNSKKRTQTSQSSELSIVGGRESPVKLPEQNKTQIPLGNQKIKEAMQSSKRKNSKASQFHVNGRGVNSQIINLLEKLEELESFEKLRRRREVSNEEEEEYLHGRTNMLKKEQERLSTAFEAQQRTKFKPIGRVRKEPKHSYDRGNIKFDEGETLKKMHNRANRGAPLKPLKRSQVVLSSNYVGQASLHLVQGLPQSIRSKMPNKKIKRSQGYIPFIEQRPEQQGSIDKHTPILQSKDMFLLSNFHDL